MSPLPSGFLDLLKILVRVPSVVGAEDPFFTALRRELDERGARVTWYQGLLVAHGSDPESALFSAHVDRHGLVCTGPNEFQYAAFVAGRRSDLLGNSVSEAFMSRVAGRFDAARVIAYDPRSGAYRGAGVVDRAYICDRRRNLIFEIQGLGHLDPGTPVAFMDRLTVTDDRLSGQLDNVLGVAHLVHLFERGFQGTALFAAQEESGSSWRYLMEWFRRHRSPVDDLIVLDTSPFLDTDVVTSSGHPSGPLEGRRSGRSGAAGGSGAGLPLDIEAGPAPDVVLRTRDANAPFNPRLSQRLEELCLEEGIPYLFKDRFIDELNRASVEGAGPPRSLGSTELGRLVAASDGAVQGTTLQIPTVGYHTVDETATLRSNAAFARLLGLLAGVD